jgi:L-threonine-O-3-phosphate decarboxylase
MGREAGLEPDRILDFTANINPLGPPGWIQPLVSAQLDSLIHYPDAECSRLTAVLARRHHGASEEILVGNGSSELLYLVPRVLPVTRALIPVPADLDYSWAASLAGLPRHYHYLSETGDFRLVPADLEARLTGGELVFLGQPNNPTGLMIDPQALRDLASRHPETFFLVDEAFADFVEGLEHMTTNRPPNIIVLLSFSKFYAIPGLRLGAAVLDRLWVKKIRKILPPWTVNTLAQRVGEAALQDIRYTERSHRVIKELRSSLIRMLSRFPSLRVYPGEANFLFIRLHHPDLQARDLARRLLTQGVAIRVCDNYEGLDGRFFRVAVRTEEENQVLAEALDWALSGKPEPKHERRKTRPSCLREPVPMPARVS